LFERRAVGQQDTPNLVISQEKKKKKVPERRSGLRPSEKELPERRSGAFRHKNTSGSNRLNNQPSIHYSFFETYLFSTRKILGQNLLSSRLLL
jgi:hypothetical protein